jgi:hypothetical protein
LVLLVCACGKKESKFGIRYTVPEGAFSAALERAAFVRSDAARW